MTQIILIESNSSIRKLYSTNLQTYCGAQVIHQSSADATIEYLKENDNNDNNDNKVRLIISADTVGTENTSLKIYYYLTSQKLNIPFILLGSNPKLVEKVEMFEPKSWQDVIKAAAKYLEVTADKMASLSVSEYYPIDIENLVCMEKSSCDIYHYNKNLDKDGNRYTKMFPASWKIDQNIIKNEVIKGGKLVYVKREDRLKFVNNFSEQVVEYLRQEDLALDKRIQATAKAYQGVVNLASAAGLSENAVKMAETSIASMTTMIESSDGFADLFAILKENQDGFLYSHSMLIALISHYVIRKMEWGTPEQQDKIVFCAFFHDISITDDKFAQISSEEELKSADLNEADKDLVTHHALKSADLVKGYPNIPFGADIIILQHHGQLNGVGFPDHFSHRLSPLAIVFLIVEEYALTLMQTDISTFDRIAYLNRMSKKYDKGNYKKVVDALKQANI